MANIDFSHLRRLIGERVDYRGTRCRLVEVVEDEQAVVLEACHRFSELQSDQTGNTSRRVPKLISVRVFLPGGAGLNPEFIDLGLPLTDD